MPDQAPPSRDVEPVVPPVVPDEPGVVPPVEPGTSPASPAEGPAPLPPEHRRRWLLGTLVTVVLAVALVVGGPWVYARIVTGAGEEPLELSTPTPSATVPPGPPVAIDVDGAWQVGPGSLAGYRITEVLNGESVVVVGRTEDVTGSMTVTDGVLTAARVVVGTASIVTDSSARDAYFRRALDTTTYPEAVFELTVPVDVSAIGTAPEPVTVVAEGTMTLRGVTRPATATLQVQRTAQGVEVAGSVPVVLTDFGLDPPDLGFVTVEPNGAVEMLLDLVR
ncbi:MAG TPA: YceI family protein [Actinotalea sp.]|nr:YceI family protein [Actinotalea sp.]